MCSRRQTCPPASRRPQSPGFVHTSDSSVGRTPQRCNQMQSGSSIATRRTSGCRCVRTSRRSVRPPNRAGALGVRYICPRKTRSLLLVPIHANPAPHSGHLASGSPLRLYPHSQCPASSERRIARTKGSGVFFQENESWEKKRLEIMYWGTTKKKTPDPFFSLRDRRKKLIRFRCGTPASGRSTAARANRLLAHREQRGADGAGLVRRERSGVDAHRFRDEAAGDLRKRGTHLLD